MACQYEICKSSKLIFLTLLVYMCVRAFSWETRQRHSQRRWDLKMCSLYYSLRVRTLRPRTSSVNGAMISVTCYSAVCVHILVICDTRLLLNAQLCQRPRKRMYLHTYSMYRMCRSIWCACVYVWNFASTLYQWGVFAVYFGYVRALLVSRVRCSFASTDGCISPPPKHTHTHTHTSFRIFCQCFMVSAARSMVSHAESRIIT